jgi:hypothetical protein
MKTLLSLSVLLLAGVRLETAAPIRVEADFISKEAQKYFPAVGSAKFWGQPVEGWWVALKEPGDCSYVSGGGFGEFIPVHITVFTDSPNWQKWGAVGSLDFLLTVTSANHKALTFDRRLSKGSFAGCGLGSCWTFGTQIALHELTANWGSLPGSLTVRATLSGMANGPVGSASPPVSLTGIPLEEATICQRVNSLSPGQSKVEVMRIAGQPEKTTFLPRSADYPTDKIRLDFRDPSLSAFDMKKSFISVLLDTDGKVLETFVCYLCGC